MNKKRKVRFGRKNLSPTMHHHFFPFPPSFPLTCLNIRPHACLGPPPPPPPSKLAGQNPVGHGRNALQRCLSPPPRNSPPCKWRRPSRPLPAPTRPCGHWGRSPQPRSGCCWPGDAPVQTPPTALAARGRTHWVV
jgi:hypothetical protein